MLLQKKSKETGKSSELADFSYFLSRKFKQDLASVGPKIQKAAKNSKGLVACLGSSRINHDSPDYVLAQETFYELGKNGYGVITGSGPGIMKAANIGAIDANSISIGIQPANLLSAEPCNIQNKLHYTVHSMHARKILIYANSLALIFFPGGFGTMDELFESLVLRQMNKMRGVPIILMGTEKYWRSFLKWMHNLVSQNFISKKEVDFLHFARTPKEALDFIKSLSSSTKHKLDELINRFSSDMKKCKESLRSLMHPFLSVFGSSRITSSSIYYKSAKSLAESATSNHIAICSGGGNGIMKAVAEGAANKANLSFGLIPTYFYSKENPNPSESSLIILNLIASRKVILGSADALVFYPGGYGTLDEFFEYTTRISIRDMERVPLIAIGNGFWNDMKNWLLANPVEMGLISDSQMNLITYAKDEKEALSLVLHHISRVS
ncbi:MAG: TIGR00730 family Rossman fold protein [Candidatus Anstonellaceae archaeon]